VKNLTVNGKRKKLSAKTKPSFIALLWRPLCQPLDGLYGAMHGMLSWAPSKRVISDPLARRFRPEVVPVGSKIGNAIGSF